MTRGTTPNIKSAFCFFRNSESGWPCNFNMAGVNMAGVKKMAGVNMAAVKMELKSWVPEDREYNVSP